MRCTALALAAVLSTVLSTTVLAACGDDTAGAGGTGGGGTGGEATTGNGATTSSTSGADGGAGPTSSSSSGEGGDGPSGTTVGTGGDSGTGGAEPVLEEVHLIGRSELADGGPRFGWSGTTIRTRVDGAALDVAFASAPAGIWFEVEIDGASVGTFATASGASTQRIDLPSAGLHDVAVVRRNEAFFGNVTLQGVTAADGGTLVPTPVRSRRLEFIGDSLTAGYGVECASAEENFSGATESAYAAYAGVASRALEADAHVIAWSGKGMVRNCCGNTDPPLPGVYGRTLGNEDGSTWDFTRWTPDAVVVNLGTNDFNGGVDPDAFVEGYTAFLGLLRDTYPEAPIVAVTWGHWGAGNEALVTQAVTASGDPLVTTTRFVIDGGEGLGCDYHTNEVTNARFGAELAVTLGDLLGWESR